MEALFAARQYEALIRAIETLVGRGMPETSRRAWLYSRCCLEVGQPERLIQTASRFREQSWRHRGFRSQYFQALMSLDRVREARSLALDSVWLGAFDMEFLLRVVGEYRRLDDDALVKELVELVYRHWRSQINAQSSIFLQNILLNIGSPLAAVRYALPAKNDAFAADRYLLLANASILKGNSVAAVDQFNLALSGFGLSPASLRDSERPLAATNLASTSGLPLRDGPLVTIAMSTFNAAETVLPALMSLTAQTYRTIEVLVVDDCSTDRTTELVERYAHEVDSRVRLLRRDVNGGTYRARNHALGESSGTYFTCNDADDWSHPEKIAHLVEAVESGSCVASQSGLVRLNPKIGIKPKRNGYVHADTSSTLFNREAVLGRIGFYDPVRFGADSEYIERLNQAFGAGSIKKLTKPLLVAHWADDTLSAGFGTGISDSGILYPQRAAYRNAFRMRHTLGEALKRERDGTPVSAGHSSDGAGAVGSTRPGWSLEGSTLFYREGGIELFWRMPAGFKMPSNALLALAESLLFKHFGRVVAVEPETRPTPEKGGVAVAFSGGIDSTAALRLLPDPIPIYTQVQAPKGKHRLDNALLAVEEVGGISIVSNYDELPMFFGERRGYFGFGAFTVTSVLLADHFNLRTVADGNIVDSMYLLGPAGHGTLWSPRDPTDDLAMFRRAGLEYCVPCGGLSEVWTEQISRGVEYAMGCMRGVGGKPCGSCMKCYRKGALRGEPIASCPESEKILAREAVPLLGALLWAVKHRNLSHPRLVALGDKDISWVDKWYPRSIEYIPPHLRSFFLGRLEYYGIEPVSDPSPIEAWDSRDTLDGIPCAADSTHVR